MKLGAIDFFTQYRQSFNNVDDCANYIDDILNNMFMLHDEVADTDSYQQSQQTYEEQY